MILFFICLALLFFTFYSGFVHKWPEEKNTFINAYNAYLRGGARAGFVLCLILVLLTGYFWATGRKKSVLSEISSIIEPVPGVEEVVNIPNPREMSAITKSLEVLSRPLPPDPVFFDKLDKERLKDLSKEFERQSEIYWMVITRMRPEFVRKFYLDENHRKGWEITEEGSVSLSLKKGNSHLIIFFLEDYLDKNRTRVTYVFEKDRK